MSDPDAFTEKLVIKISPNQRDSLKERARAEGDSMNVYARRVLIRDMNGGVVEYHTKYSFDFKLIMLVVGMFILLLTTFIMQLKVAGFI